MSRYKSYGPFGISVVDTPKSGILSREILKNQSYLW